MADVLHRVTRELRRSVHSPDFPVQDWIHGPNLAAVAGFDSSYWTITGDAVTLMSPAERSAVDAAALIVRRDSTAAELDQLEGVVRAFMLVVLDELNLHALKLNAILDAVDAAANLADLKTRVGAIADYPPRTTAQLKTSVRGKLGT